VSPQPSSGPAAVLVAADDAHVRAMLSLGLRQAGFDPLVAADGHEAVELLLRHRDDVRVVLLDVKMPGLDGPGALAQIRRIVPEVPCCFMTGDSERNSAERLLALGVACVIEKPFRLDEVLKTLGELCGQSR
jgi:CheY-like chemotaxis protein